MLTVFLILNQFVISITFLSACVIRYTYLTRSYYVKIDKNYSLLLVCLSIHTLSVCSYGVRVGPAYVAVSSPTSLLDSLAASAADGSCCGVTQNARSIPG